MAFIREYAEASGDPFRFRLPKKLRRAFTPPRFVRKFQPGRAAAGLARIAAPLAAAALPGVGGLAAGIASQYLGDAGDMGFARAYGIEAGDPIKLPKRKTAASGPKIKASKKAAHRAAKGHGINLGALAKGGLGVLQQAASIPALQQFLPQAIQQGLAVPGADEAAAAAGGPTGVFDFGASALPTIHGGRHTRINPRTGLPMRRRSMNVTNVKALRRSMRRVEGFGQLARRILPQLGFHVSSHSQAPRGRRSRGRGLGHRAGCRCVVCSRKG